MNSPYEDLMDLPHHVSAVHPPMGMHERAAQFSPFAALTGYEDAIIESRRLTHRKIELSEDEKRELDQKQRILTALLPQRPTITVTYFVPDTRKQGGSYQTVTAALRRIDETAQTLHMTDGQVIALEQIVALELPEIPPTLL